MFGVKCTDGQVLFTSLTSGWISRSYSCSSDDDEYKHGATEHLLPSSVRCGCHGRRRSQYVLTQALESVVGVLLYQLFTPA